ncbi:MAG TPA: hypothetical protein VKT77_17585, partial [Chthonomonadaceae bacterium]|nr:hypothetical protein [Chthonomonadaceae bacterium]
LSLAVPAAIASITALSLIAGCQPSDSTAGVSQTTNPAAGTSSPAAGNAGSPAPANGDINAAPTAAPGSAPGAGRSSSGTTSVGGGSGTASSAIAGAIPMTNTGAQDVLNDTGGSTDHGLSQATGKVEGSSPAAYGQLKPDGNGQYTSGPPGDPLTQSRGAK